MKPEGAQGTRDFRTTHWSLVADAADSRAPGAEEALAEICRAYWAPLYVFARTQGVDPEEARDLTQGFFEYFLEQKVYAGADRSRGRFRSFLMSSMRNYCTNQWKHSNRKKRGGGMEVVPLEVESAEEAYLHDAGLAMPQEALFDRKWAKAVLNRVLKSLEQEYRELDQVARFEAMKPMLGLGADGSMLSEKAELLGMAPGAFRTALHRFRARYRELFRIEVASQVNDPRDVDDEIRHLIAALGRDGG
jgi:RNA polymerase sigma-70 factor (ECF subfamily)